MDLSTKRYGKERTICIEISPAEFGEAIRGKVLTLPLEDEEKGEWTVWCAKLNVSEPPSDKTKKLELLRHIESQAVWSAHHTTHIKNIPTNLISICGEAEREGLIQVDHLIQGKELSLTGKGKALLDSA